jgi:hypothetical protein
MRSKTTPNKNENKLERRMNIEYRYGFCNNNKTKVGEISSTGTSHTQNEGNLGISEFQKNMVGTV